MEREHPSTNELTAWTFRAIVVGALVYLVCLAVGWASIAKPSGWIAVAGEDQAADERTLILLERFSRDPAVEKARAEFDRAQKVEEEYHHDFDGSISLNR